MDLDKLSGIPSWAMEQMWDNGDPQRAVKQTLGFKGEETLELGCRDQEEQGRASTGSKGSR